MDPSPADDERTVVRPAAARPGRLGHILPNGTRLRDFEVTGLIGEGGFGIVYLAYDHSLERRVALKEYMPSSMAARVAGGPTVMVKSERHQEAFDAGLRSFVNEARLLARFDHPSLVKVYRFWEEHGTAYMVMPYYEGPTLRAALAARATPPDEATLRAWLRPLLDALEVMHASHCYHRDIAPDNILLTQTGPLLLDFGAARRVIGDMTHALTVVLKPGYAPIEQYGEVAAMAQGAWTDFYALASVVHFAITGRVPPSSVERLLDDRLERLGTFAAGRYSARFLAAIDAALAVRPENRPQTDAQFRALLDEPRSMVGLTGPAFGPVSRPVPLDDGASRPGRFDDSEANFAHPAEGNDSDVTWQHAAGSRREATTKGDSSPSPATTSAATTSRPNTPAVPRAWWRRPAALFGIVVSMLVLILAGAYLLQDMKASTADSQPPSSTATTTPVAPTAAATQDALRQPSATTAPAPPAITATESVSAAPAMPPSSVAPAVPATTEATVAAPATAPLVPAPPPTSSTRATGMQGEPSISAAAPPDADAREPRPGARNTEASRSAPPSSTRVVRPPRSAEPGPRATSQERARPEAARPAPTYDAATSSRCGDILQKASLEPLSAAEVAYLKRECR